MREKPSHFPNACTETAAAAPARAPLGPRKLAMRIMLGVLGASVLLGLAGKGRAHVATGLVFSALLADHVWKRRKAL